MKGRGEGGESEEEGEREATRVGEDGDREGERGKKRESEEAGGR